MKQLINLFILFYAFAAFAQNADNLFTTANDLYTTGKYTEAVETYHKIEELDVESADLYFNLGNCYYKLNKVAPSIYYYEKALKLNPNHAEAAANLAFAKRMTIDVIEQLPQTFLQRFSKNVIQKFSFDTWAYGAVIASFLASLLFLIYYFSFKTKLKLLFFNLSLVSFFGVVLCAFFAFKNYNTVQKNREAIIFAQKTEIKNAPTPNGDMVFELHEGTKVLILDELQAYKKIKIADGKTGWMRAADLKEVN